MYLHRAICPVSALVSFSTVIKKGMRILDIPVDDAGEKSYKS